MFLGNMGSNDGMGFPGKGWAGREEKPGRVNSGQIGLGKRYELLGDFVFGKKNRFGKQYGIAWTNGVASTLTISEQFGLAPFLFCRAEFRVHRLSSSSDESIRSREFSFVRVTVDRMLLSLRLIVV